MRKAVLGIAMLLAISGCSAAPEATSAGCDGVVVEVNFGTLNAERITACIGFEGKEILAKDVLSQAGVEIEGTLTYPDQIVCRVNGLPSETEALEIEGQEPYLETCTDMPPDFAYWALWVRNGDASQWEYATEGAANLKLTKGQSVGLAFASGDLAPTPSE